MQKSHNKNHMQKSHNKNHLAKLYIAKIYAIVL